MDETSARDAPPEGERSLERNPGNFIWNEGHLELINVDGTRAIGIEEVESLLDLFNLILGKSVLGCKGQGGLGAQIT